MKKLWIFALEPIDTRYTGQWFTYVQDYLSQELPDYEVVTISGKELSSEVTPGAFLNFASTNFWKSTQLEEFLIRYNEGAVGKDDRFLFTDFWNTSVLQLKYMNDLLGMNWKFHGLVHAGNYDPSDFLGRLGNVDWIKHTEVALFNAFDKCYFATEFHLEMFQKNLLSKFYSSADLKSMKVRKKLNLCGWPMAYLKDVIKPGVKEDIILFPHRVSLEKQPEIFRDLAKEMPEYKFIVCQDTKLTKDEYHELLGRSKILFSANLQETLGITTCGEGPLAEVIPLAPDRLSYSEIFDLFGNFLYPSEWTEDWSSYQKNKQKVIDRIRFTMKNYDKIVEDVREFNSCYFNIYFSADLLVGGIRDD